MGAVGVGPGGEQAAKVDQRIADRRQFPVDDRQQRRAVMGKEEVADVEVAVDDGGPEVPRKMGVQPGGEAFGGGKIPAYVPARILIVAVELAQPARCLPTSEAGRVGNECVSKCRSGWL